jgi:hypothetical protein
MEDFREIRKSRHGHKAFSSCLSRLLCSCLKAAPARSHNSARCRSIMSRYPIPSSVDRYRLLVCMNDPDLVVQFVWHENCPINVRRGFDGLNGGRGVNIRVDGIKHCLPLRYRMFYVSLIATVIHVI